MDTSETSQDAPSSRWFQRVLPLTGAVVLVIALAALAIPGFRDQVKLSTSRKAQPFVALYFARTSDGGQVVCSRKGQTVRVQFDIESHLEKQQPVAFRVSVLPTGRKKAQSGKGSVQPVPGTKAHVRTTFSVPRKDGYTISVSLPALGQQLRAHCSGRR